MYQGFTTTNEQDRARWELMQKRAQAKADASRKPMTPHTLPQSK
jgi:hypothetical protein